jgi:hypothetical protein
MDFQRRREEHRTPLATEKQMHFYTNDSPLHALAALLVIGCCVGAFTFTVFVVVRVGSILLARAQVEENADL